MKAEPSYTALLKKSGAKKGKPPSELSLQLATLVEQPPSGPNWIHEEKLDGYRIIAVKGKGPVRFFSRQGQEWTSKFSTLIPAFDSVLLKSFIFDGEIAVRSSSGVTNFQLLQNFLSNPGTLSPLYFVFDLLFLDGFDVTPLALRVRKKILAAVTKTITSRKIISTKYTTGDGPKAFQIAKSKRLEGIISKNLDLPYTPGRNLEWRKCKRIENEELIVIGYTMQKDSSSLVGALLLGFYLKKELRYCGKVGTGFSVRERGELFQSLRKISALAPPHNAPRLKVARWVQPKLVVQVEFTEWTDEYRLRHPSFKGIREDKTPKDVIYPGKRRK